MSLVELTNPPKLDVVLFVSLSGLEIATALPAETPEQVYKSDDIVKAQSYHTKKIIDIIVRNMVLIERLSEAEYLTNVEKAKEQKVRGQLDTPGFIMPIARIPGKMH